ncbi:cytosolic thiouridylase subunit 2 [Planoprotostelium fungivorum]|uniref:Cytoplasmic tRNA 2-thiolation protein 2 n=1 Tax=Planoprotostelium fungivorum TaxID=1890364 RepID=A0A2P6MSF9_9EUKA|nr:cytosolic thiouridylase subunit 2 [Planoprotostelium fungivorum]
MSEGGKFEDNSCGEVPPEEARRQADRLKKKISDICVKCRTEKSTLLFRKESICWPCYEDQIIRKFKTQLNATRKNKSQLEKVLIAFSGGPSSRALIHILNECILGRSNQASAFFEIGGIIHIDESGVTKPETAEEKEKLAQVAASYNIPYHSVPFGSIFNDSENPTQETNREKIEKLMQGCTTNTTREDIIFHMRNLLIANTARTLGYEKVLFGTSASRMATTLISLVCKGRGYNVAQEIGNNDTKYGDVQFGYPMRDFLGKEVSVYNHHKHLEDVFLPSLDTKTSDPKFSIDHLTESFIEGLQVDFSHTVHTLLRSSVKLTMPKIDQPMTCSICAASLLPSTTSQSIGGEGKEDSCCGENGCGGEEWLVVVANISDYVCGGCHRVMNEISPQVLPPYVQHNADRNGRSSRLRSQIEDYLLDDGE